MKGKWCMGLTVICVFCVGNGLANTITPVEDGYISLHQGNYSVVTDYWTAIVTKNVQDARGIMEFELSAIDETVISATLTIWQLDRFNHTGGVNLYTYAGDGQITQSDFDRTATFITTMDFPAGYNYGYGIPFDTDVLSAIQQAQAQGWEYLGLRLESDCSSGDVHYATQGTTDWPYLGGQPPRLTYEVPEPAVLSLLAIGGLALIRRRKSRA